MRATTLIKTPSAIPTRTRGAVTTRTAAKASMRGARAVTNAVPIHIGTFDASDDDSWFRSQRGGVALSIRGCMRWLSVRLDARWGAV